VRLRLLKDKDGAEVLPVFFDDNYISLLPGEKREITAHVRKSDLGAAKPVLAVDGFNVTPAHLPTSTKIATIFSSGSVSNCGVCQAFEVTDGLEAASRDG
jgi:Ig-like domain-containing protein